MIILLILFTTAYAFLIGLYAMGWSKIDQWNVPVDFFPNTKVSVLIPARNESETISACIESVLNQNYPRELLEVIVINDQSSDDTSEQVKFYERVELIELKENQGKKGALSRGIKKATGSLIVTTDADCTFDKNWLSTIVSFYEEEKKKMIVAPVKFEGPRSFLEKFQTLDFIGMQGVTGASSYWQISNMANGANLAFEKSAFLNVDGYQGNLHIASGDDFFLIDKISKAYPNGVGYLKSSAAVVKTKAESTISQFINQRVRWASKSSKNTDHRITAVLSFLLLYNLLLVAGLIMGFIYNPVIIVAVIGALLVKAVVDFLYLFRVSDFFNQRHLLWSFIPAQLFYYLYIPVVGIYSNFFSYEWKGRVFR